jgi:hypothetical protein
MDAQRARDREEDAEDAEDAEDEDDGAAADALVAGDESDPVSQPRHRAPSEEDDGLLRLGMCG